MEVAYARVHDIWGIRCGNGRIGLVDMVLMRSWKALAPVSLNAGNVFWLFIDEGFGERCDRIGEAQNDPAMKTTEYQEEFLCSYVPRCWVWRQSCYQGFTNGHGAGTDNMSQIFNFIREKATIT